MTGQIVPNGIADFSPIIDKLGAIAEELIPYMLYIALGCASIWLVYEAVRYLIKYIKMKNFNAFYYRDYEGGYGKNGVFHAKFKRKERKHIKRERIKYFR